MKYKIILLATFLITVAYSLLISLLGILVLFLNHLFGSSSCEVFTIEHVLKSIPDITQVLIFWLIITITYVLFLFIEPYISKIKSKISIPKKYIDGVAKILAISILVATIITIYFMITGNLCS